MIPLSSIKCTSLLICASFLTMMIVNIAYFDGLHFGINVQKYPREKLVGQTTIGRATTPDKGIVMCVGNDDGLIAGALFTVQQLRETYHSPLQVSINHCNELSSKTMSLFTHYKGVTVKNMCNKNTSKQEQTRLKGWFCKTMALVSSEFKQTMVIDTDVLWFRDPSHLFNNPGYLSSGALFFRDRFLYESPMEKDGLEMDAVKHFIEVESGYSLKINSTVAKVLAESNGINFFWRNAQNSTRYRAIRHVQESSVIILDKSRLPKTINVLRRLFLTFRLGIYPRQRLLHYFVFVEQTRIIKLSSINLITSFLLIHDDRIW